MASQLWTDEARSSLHRTVKIHNFVESVERGTQYPYSRAVPSPCVTVWWGFIASIIVEPIIFQERFIKGG